jgi:thioredoxin-related protein
MRKKIIILILSIIVAGSATLLAVQVNKYNTKAKLKAKQTNTFPVIELLSLQHQTFSTRQLADSTVYKLIVLVDPECDHCDFEINEIVRDADKFRNAAILFISPKPVEELKKYKQKIEGAGLDNMKIFSLRSEELYKHFNGHSFPEIYLYGKDNQLIKNFGGETPSGVILSAMNQ